jgi:hypothetical protein
VPAGADRAALTAALPHGSAFAALAAAAENPSLIYEYSRDAVLAGASDSAAAMDRLVELLLSEQSGLPDLPAKRLEIVRLAAATWDSGFGSSHIGALVLDEIAPDDCPDHSELSGDFDPGIARASYEAALRLCPGDARLQAKARAAAGDWPGVRALAAGGCETAAALAARRGVAAWADIDAAERAAVLAHLAQCPHERSRWLTALAAAESTKRLEAIADLPEALDVPAAFCPFGQLAWHFTRAWAGSAAHLAAAVSGLPDGDHRALLLARFYCRPVGDPVRESPGLLLDFTRDLFDVHSTAVLGALAWYALGETDPGILRDLEEELAEDGYPKLSPLEKPKRYEPKRLKPDYVRG